MWRYTGIGFELVAAIGLSILLGWWIDGRFGTEPWGLLVGAFIGVVGGMFNLIRESLAAAKSSSGDAGDSEDDSADGRPGGGRNGKT